MRRRRGVVAQTVARQFEVVDFIDDVRSVQLRVLVGRVVFVDIERDGLRDALGKVRERPVLEREILAPRRRICRGVIVLYEGPRPTDEIEAHQFPPVVGVFALLERGE